MTKSILKISLLTLVAAAITAAPAQLLAQNSNKAPVINKAAASKAAVATKPAVPDKQAPPAGKKLVPGPFRGKLAAVDQAAKTIRVGKRTFQITSETRMKKDGKPATLDQGVVGEIVSGYVKPTKDGKLAATVVTFGPKVSGKAKGSEKSSSPRAKK